jgi:hypothetical protein
VLGVFQQTIIGQVLIGQPLDNCNTRFGATSPVHYGYSHVLNATARMAERLLEFAIRPRSPSQRFGDSTAIADVGAFASSRTRVCATSTEAHVLHAFLLPSPLSQTAPEPLGARPEPAPSSGVVASHVERLPLTTCNIAAAATSPLWSTYCHVLNHAIQVAQCLAFFSNPASVKCSSASRSTTATPVLEPLHPCTMATVMCLLPQRAWPSAC